MVGMSSVIDFCNKIRVFVTLSDFSENLAKVWQGQKNSNPIERGERPTLSHRFELSYTSLGQKLTEIRFLFVCLLSSAFLQSFHYCSFSLVKRTINLVIFSSNFQGFTLLPWQKVGRIWLGFDGNPSSSLFVSLLSCSPYLLKVPLFVCLLSCSPYLSKFPLFVGLLSFSLPFFPPPSRQTNDIFVNFFFKFFKASP